MADAPGLRETPFWKGLTDNAIGGLLAGGQWVEGRPTARAAEAWAQRAVGPELIRWAERYPKGQVLGLFRDDLVRYRLITQSRIEDMASPTASVLGRLGVVLSAASLTEGVARVVDGASAWGTDGVTTWHGVNWSAAGAIVEGTLNASTAAVSLAQAAGWLRAAATATAAARGAVWIGGANVVSAGLIAYELTDLLFQKVIDPAKGFDTRAGFGDTVFNLLNPRQVASERGLPADLPIRPTPDRFISQDVTPVDPPGGDLNFTPADPPTSQNVTPADPPGDDLNFTPADPPTSVNTPDGLIDMIEHDPTPWSGPGGHDPGTDQPPGVPLSSGDMTSKVPDLDPVGTDGGCVS